jgi:hypothetical protein
MPQNRTGQEQRAGRHPVTDQSRALNSLLQSGRVRDPRVPPGQGAAARLG